MYTSPFRIGRKPQGRVSYKRKRNETGRSEWIVGFGNVLVGGITFDGIPFLFGGQSWPRWVCRTNI